MWVQRPNFEGTNFDSFEIESWSWVWPHIDPRLHFGSSNHEISFWAFQLVQTNWFPSKMVPCTFNFDLPLFSPSPSSKGHESNLWLSSNRIALFATRVFFCLLKWHYKNKWVGMRYGSFFHVHHVMYLFFHNCMYDFDNCHIHIYLIVHAII
jgi:hypothetical protein